MNFSKTLARTCRYIQHRHGDSVHTINLSFSLTYVYRLCSFCGGSLNMFYVFLVRFFFFGGNDGLQISLKRNKEQPQKSIGKSHYLFSQLP